MLTTSDFHKELNSNDNCFQQILLCCQYILTVSEKLTANDYFEYRNGNLNLGMYWSNPTYNSFKYTAINGEN